MQEITTKKWLAWGAIGVAVSAFVLPVCADETPADTNAVQMVTYFPVPYARYDNLYIQKELDVGTLFDESFKLELGSFQAKKVNLLTSNVEDTTSTLKMGTDFKTTVATFGDTEGGESAPTLRFKDLYLNKVTGASSVSLEIPAIKANNRTQLKVFGKELPKCDGTVKWKRISGVCHLVCCSDSCTGLENCSQ